MTRATIRAACVQMEHAPTLDAGLAAARTRALAAAAQGAEVVLLPEYFYAPRAPAPGGPGSLAARAADVHALLADASRDAGVLLAGNVIEERGGERLNVLHAYDAGRHVAEQAKIHPMPREAETGIAGGAELQPFDARDVRIGGLVCADIFYPEASRVLSLRGAEVLLNPVMSPYNAVDPTKAARESVFVARAWDSAAFVLKAGGFARGERSVVGRSLIAAPWGLVARYQDEFAEEILVADLDLAMLRDFRARHRGFQARAPKAYRALFDD